MPKASTDAQKEARGTLSPHRARPAVVRSLPGTPRKLDNMGDMESTLWDEVVEDSVARGVSLRGCERKLRAYVYALADMERRREAGDDVPSSLYMCIARLGSEFYEDPVSQRSKPGEKVEGGAFAQDPAPPK